MEQKVVVIWRAVEFLSQSSNTREASRKRIVAGCDALQEGAQKLLKDLDRVGPRRERLRTLEKATYALEERTRGVRREVSRSSGILTSVKPTGRPLSYTPPNNPPLHPSANTPLPNISHNTPLPYTLP